MALNSCRVPQSHFRPVGDLHRALPFPGPLVNTRGYNLAPQNRRQAGGPGSGPPLAPSRKLQCEFCGASFTSSSGLYRHKAKVHLNKLRFSCDICGKGFNVRELYEDHVNMHYNIKAHKCPYCPSVFTYKTNMYHHIREKHRKNSGGDTGNSSVG
ncbi:hypothetical protein ACOMHN_052557 [Nucella lapillus]